MSKELKKAALENLKASLDERIQAAWKAMQAAQESANSEGKSSAGDKYETSRAMGQLDRDMFARQYEQARMERQLLDRIDSDALLSRTVMGALVSTSSGWILLAVSAGKISVEGQPILAVSPQSPLGNALMGKQIGEIVPFQRQNYIILDLF